MVHSGTIIIQRQWQGTSPLRNESVSRFQDECVAVSAVDKSYQSYELASFASDAAVWAYKHIRLRPFYWNDKRKFTERIMRTVNLGVWKKRQQYDLPESAGVSITVAVISDKSYWVGIMGTGIAYVRPHNGITTLYQSVSTEKHTSGIPAGVVRYGIDPLLTHGEFVNGDALFISPEIPDVGKLKISQLVEMIQPDEYVLSDTLEQIHIGLSRDGIDSQLTGVFLVKK